ncbi:TonB-dependent receptor [Gabonibacter massiliensis]|uniref:TonB-dependent receptor n=1 Tax=Gabonibacter massiliensis TaxID=1720195 RepID=UPI00073E97B9|nr:TonB-dependent receptor [Gabonibacter massiliensis]
MKYIMIVLLMLGTFMVRAEIIKGRVMEEAADGLQPIAGANVYWLGTSKGVVADEKGEFKIKWDDSGKLVASFIGFQSDTVEVKSTDKFVEFVLIEGRQLDEVSVVSRKRSTVMSTNRPVIEQVITGTELLKAACCNLGESFETNASVDVSYADAVTGAKQIQLLGLTGKYIQLMTENFPNFRGLSSLYGLGYIPGPWMEAISISKGTGSVVNGYESIVGQISVDYKKPQNSEKLYLNAYYSDDGMFEFNSNFGVKFNDRWSTMFLIHGDWLDKVHDGNKDGFSDMPEKTQYNVMNRWAYKDDKWFFQFGGKFLDEERKGGESKHHSVGVNSGSSYRIGIDTRRYEGFLKWGYLMPRYDYTSMALMINYTDHDQDSYYGLKRYDARQRNLYLNYIFQSIFGSNPDQQYATGISFNYDDYDEYFQDRYFTDDNATVTNPVNFERQEKAVGAFFQYTGMFFDKKITFMAGLRYDHHNLYGNFVTPRLHLMFRPDEMTNLKLTAGRGLRMSNILAENSYLLASSAGIYVNGKLLVENPGELKHLKMEDAWNIGVNLNRKFYLFNRILSISADCYHTKFTDQVVVDNETAFDRVNFYNLEGKSYSNSYQIEMQYEVIPRLDLLAAYRYNDVKTTLHGRKTEMLPLASRYKGLLNLSYHTNMRKWQFDFTTQFNGGGRMPRQTGIPETYQTGSNFKAFQLMNAQVTKFFRRWSVYGGCENMGDFKQKHPVIASDDPWGKYFDSSKIWGPVHGRKFYIGIRFALDRES